MGRMNAKTFLLLLCLCSNALFSATWIGSANPDDWDTDTNWQNPATHVNAPSAVANFNSPTPPIPAGTPVVRLATVNTRIGTLLIDSAQNYTFAQTGAGSLRFEVSAGQSASLNVTTSLGNGAYTISAPVVLNDSLIVTQNSSGIFTISGEISQVSSGKKLTKEGTGVLALTNASNSFSGGIVIDAGTLSVSSDAALGAAGTSVTISNGTLNASASFPTTRAISTTGNARVAAGAGFTLTLNGTISGTGGLNKTDTGIVVLGNTGNNYTGGTTVTSGVLSISNNGNLGDSSGSLNFGGGTLLLNTNNLTISRSGTTNGSSTIDTLGHTVTMNGNFGGGGSFTITNGGTVLLYGSNTYTGGTTVDANTILAGSTQGIQGNVSLAAASSILTFLQNFDGNYSGVITGAGTLNKNETGAVNFSGNSTGFTGPTQINEGTLNINGSIENSSLVTVNSGATLGGSGTVGPVTSSGTISPGSGVGTLNINGPLIMNAGSNVEIDLSPTDADLIAVAGTATFGGSVALNIVPESGFYGFSVDRTILTSTALVGPPGTGFSPVTSSIDFFVSSVTYTATSVLLHIDVLKPFGLFQFSNQNTQAVGDNIDAVFAAGELSEDLINVVNTFVGQNETVINAALDQMHPAPYSAYIDQQAEVMGPLIHRFHRQPYLPCACSNPNRFWVQPFGASLTVKDHGIQIGYQGNSGGLALGYDGEIAPNWTFGFGTAWNTTHLDLRKHRGKGEINGFYGSAYTDYQWGSFYFGAALLSGVDFYDTTRDIKFLDLHRKSEASFRSVDVIGQITSAYLFGAPQAFFYPYFNLDYLYFSTEGYQEKGAGSLSLKVEGRGDGILRTETGLALQVQDINAAQTMCISPQVSLGFVNMTSIQRPMYESFFQEETISFKTRGWDITWNLLHVDFGLSIVYKCFSLGLQYNVELSPDHKTLLYNQYGNMRLDWKW